MATHSSILAWKNPLERGAWRATVLGVSRVGHNLATKPPPPPKAGKRNQQLITASTYGLFYWSDQQLSLITAYYFKVHLCYQYFISFYDQTTYNTSVCSLSVGIWVMFTFWLLHILLLQSARSFLRDICFISLGIYL